MTAEDLEHNLEEALKHTRTARKTAVNRDEIERLDIACGRLSEVLREVQRD